MGYDDLDPMWKYYIFRKITEEEEKKKKKKTKYSARFDKINVKHSKVCQRDD